MKSISQEFGAGGSVLRCPPGDFDPIRSLSRILALLERALVLENAGHRSLPQHARDVATFLLRQLFNNLSNDRDQKVRYL